MSDDLIERLRSWKHTPGGVPEQRKLITDVRNAADALAAKDAAISEMRAELERVKLHLSAWEDSARINYARATAAEARADAAEEQLRRLNEAKQ